MRLDNATAQAKGARTHKQAARLYNNIEYETALGDHPPEHREEGERALKHLEERFPGVRDAAREVEEPPSLSRRAGKRLRDGEPAEHATAEEVGRERTADRRRRASERPRRARAPRSSGVRQTASRALDIAGDATGGWGELIGEVFLWGVGLSIAYLLLTHDQGVSKLFEGATTVTRAVVSPVVDPLNPKGAL